MSYHGEELLFSWKGGLLEEIPTAVGEERRGPLGTSLQQEREGAGRTPQTISAGQLTGALHLCRLYLESRSHLTPGY